MTATYIAKSGRVYSVTDVYPQISEEEGGRRQQEAILCVVKILRKQRAAQKEALRMEVVKGAQ